MLHLLPIATQSRIDKLLPKSTVSLTVKEPPIFEFESIDNDPLIVPEPDVESDSEQRPDTALRLPTQEEL